MGYQVRPGTEEDLPFIKELALWACEFSVSKIRNTPIHKVRACMEQVISMIPQIALSMPLHFYILEEVETKIKVGYMILLVNQLEASTGEKQTMIQDYALAPQYHGKHLWRLFLLKAEEVALENENFYLSAFITAENKTSLVVAEKFGGQVERYQVTKKLSPRPQQNFNNILTQC
jgi:hypothetical protein